MRELLVIGGTRRVLGHASLISRSFLHLGLPRGSYSGTTQFPSQTDGGYPVVQNGSVFPSLARPPAFRITCASPSAVPRTSRDQALRPCK